MLDMGEVGVFCRGMIEERDNPKGTAMGADIPVARDGENATNVFKTKVFKVYEVGRNHLTFDCIKTEVIPVGED